MPAGDSTKNQRAITRSSAGRLVMSCCCISTLLYLNLTELQSRKILNISQFLVEWL